MDQSMNGKVLRFLPIALFSCWFAIGIVPVAAEESSKSISVISRPSDVDQARDRARLLHEVVRGTLQVVHRDLFDEDDSFAIPSRSLEDVFFELSRGYHVKLKWLNVGTDVLNEDHLPSTAFERESAKQLAAGKERHEQVDESVYQYAGVIHLKSQCLKCHVKRRTDTKPRHAGLVITIPMRLEHETRSPN